MKFCWFCYGISRVHAMDLLFSKYEPHSFCETVSSLSVLD